MFGVAQRSRESKTESRTEAALATDPPRPVHREEAEASEDEKSIDTHSPCRGEEDKKEAESTSAFELLVEKLMCASSKMVASPAFLELVAAS